MIRGLRIDPTSATPIWSQIEDGLRRLVSSGALEAGAPVPSVRELARELRINPATVSKAYRHLARDGVLTVRRGDGTYVSDTPPEVPAAQRREALREAADAFAALAATLGASEQDTRRELERAWKAQQTTKKVTHE